MRQEAFCFDIFHQITSLVSFAQSLKPFVKFTWRCYFFFTLLGNKTHPSEPSHVELHWQEKRVLSLAMFHFWEQSEPYFGHNLKQKLWIISNCNRVPTILLDRPQEHWNFLHNHSSFITTSGKDQLVITQCPFRNEKVNFQEKLNSLVSNAALKFARTIRICIIQTKKQNFNLSVEIYFANSRKLSLLSSARTN